MAPNIDVLVSACLAVSLFFVLAAYGVGSFAASRKLVAARVEREAPLPLLGLAPMRAVYSVMVPVARTLVALRIGANTVSVSALGLAALAAAAFGLGHFGLAALAGTLASLADGLDGLVARLSGTQSRLGQVLDTTIDRYVDALFLGGIGILVRHDAWLLGLVLAAIVGSFMVSYASSIERELGVQAGAAPMRRAHRVAYLLTAAGLAPLLGHATGDTGIPTTLVLLAVAVIASVGNVSAVRRLLRAARATPATPAPTSAPTLEHSGHDAATADGAAQ